MYSTIKSHELTLHILNKTIIDSCISTFKSYIQLDNTAFSFMTSYDIHEFTQLKPGINSKRYLFNIYSQTFESYISVDRSDCINIDINFPHYIQMESICNIFLKHKMDMVLN